MCVLLKASPFMMRSITQTVGVDWSRALNLWKSEDCCYDLLIAGVKESGRLSKTCPNYIKVKSYIVSIIWELIGEFVFL